MTRVAYIPPLYRATNASSTSRGRLSTPLEGLLPSQRSHQFGRSAFHTTNADASWSPAQLPTPNVALSMPRAISRTDSMAISTLTADSYTMSPLCLISFQAWCHSPTVISPTVLKGHQRRHSLELYDHRSEYHGSKHQQHHLHKRHRRHSYAINRYSRLLRTSSQGHSRQEVRRQPWLWSNSLRSMSQEQGEM